MTRLEGSEVRPLRITVLEQLLISAYLILLPFYVLPSGMPQPADAVMVLLLIITGTAALRRQRRLSRGWFAPAVVAFVFYTAVVNTIVGIVLGGDVSLLMNSVFYLYNGMVAVVVYTLVRADEVGARSTIQYAGLASLVVQLVLVVGLGGVGESSRQAGNFNNPNQLAAYALFMCGLVLVVSADSLTGLLVAGASLFAASSLIVASLSRGGLIALPVLVVAFLALGFREGMPARVRVALVFIVGAACVVLSLYWDSVASGQAATNVDSRFDKQDSLSARGFDRILDHPEFWILGGGEGANYRFETRIELHSGWGTLLYAYGLVGIALFVRLFWRSIERGDWTFRLVILCTMIYGATHQHLRNGLLWAIMGAGAALVARIGTAEKASDGPGESDPDGAARTPSIATAPGSAVAFRTRPVGSDS